MRRRSLRILAVATTLGFVALQAAPALAVQDQPSVLVTAWYWEDQQRQRIQDPTSGTDVAVISAPNPFCPSPPLAGSPPEQACKPGRLPIQVREGDYETPNQVSAVGFDFALVPPGSKIGKFTVTFVEAKDDQSQPVNAEGKSLQACFVDEFFGDGEASVYKEMPKSTCSKTDPVAPRKELKVKKQKPGGGGNDPQPPEQDEPTFGYTFDLTEFARTWVEEASPMTAVLLMPVRPKEAQYDPATDANWRTVLVGAQEEGGIKTALSFDPPKTPLPPTPPTPPEPVTPVTPSSPVTTTTGGGSFPTSTGSGSVDTGGAPEVTDEAAAPTDLAAEAPASAVVPKGWPGYVWLTILAGIVGFSMVRSVVLERAAGIRPDGVLAQIRRLNASRRGVELAAATGEGAASLGGLAAVVAGLKSLGEKTGGIAGKLNFRKKGS